ncbi:MAG: DUF6152 family protein [Caulobacteraceae bacterium]
MSAVKKRSLAALAGGLAVLAGGAQAHHSFAVFFSSDHDVVTITGPVKAFHFTNPHGIIEIVVPGKGKADQDWKAETNSPSIMVRRGWSKDVIKEGEVVTLQGWQARDGSNYMRLRNASRADGSPIGTAPAAQ